MAHVCKFTVGQLDILVCMTGILLYISVCTLQQLVQLSCVLVQLIFVHTHVYVYTTYMCVLL